MNLDKPLLPIALQTAVPLWIELYKTKTWAELQEIAKEAGDVIAHHGDSILFASHKKGETAHAFNMLARAIAVMSFCPGGINVFGMRFEAKHPEFAYTDNAVAVQDDEEELLTV